MDTPSVNSSTRPAETGSTDSRKSRRHLSSEEALDVVRVREARRAFRDFHAQCFWYMPPDMEITLEDVPEVARGLRLHGGRRGFLLAARLSP